MQPVKAMFGELESKHEQNKKKRFLYQIVVTPLLANFSELSVLRQKIAEFDTIPE